MALESSIIPVPSEAVLIPAGFLIYQGSMSLWIVLILSVLGSLTGALASYLIALYLGRRVVNAFIEKYGSFLLVSKESVNKSERYFEKHGEITIFASRIVPVIRHLISLPAGFAKMNLTKFSAYTALGTAIWSLVLIYLGYAFGQNYDLISKNLNILTLAILIITLITIIIYILINRNKKKN